MAETKHGTAYGYKRQGCRCDDCRAAHTAQHRRWKERAEQRSPDMIPHGRGGYVNYGCRCEVCTRANSELSAEARARRGSAYGTAAGAASRQRAKERAEADPSLVPHGTYGGYSYWGCRCEGCRAAMVAYWREYRARRRPTAEASS